MIANARSGAVISTVQSTYSGTACLSRHLTVKLRGRAPTPDGAEGAQCLSAQGAKPQAHHGPLQRLLDSAWLWAQSLSRLPATCPRLTKVMRERLEERGAWFLSNERRNDFRLKYEYSA
jgi:hypothetical protein